MEKIVPKIKSFLSYHKTVRIDNVVFNLHKITAGVVFLLSLVISANIYVAKPMTCINDKAVDRVIDMYCWIHATYTLPDKLNSNKSLAIVAHPGVAGKGHLDDSKDDTIVHKYYQWVCFVLFFQAIAFYAPRSLWKNSEGGRVKALSADLDKFISDDETKTKRKLQCLEYFHKCLGSNDGRSLTFGVCEVLNFINVLIQIDLTDRFVGRALSKYGFSLIQFHRQDPMYRTDPMAIAFPTVTKCEFHMFGPSGSIVRYDALCVLPLNIYNEKFYPILWFWYITLAVISFLAIVYRITTFLFPELRYQLLVRKFRIPEDELENVWSLNSKLDYGDWFLLYQVGKNMEATTFLGFLNDLANVVLGKNFKEKSS